LIISPGWTGSSAFFFSVAYLLVVVFEIDVHCIFSGPSERDPVIPSHAHRPAPWIALKALKVKTRDIHVVRLRRDV
jgi:hypothetical protein